MTLINKADALAVIRKAQVASCTCQIKTPNPEWHSYNCRYRILREVEAMIDHLPDAAEIAALQARIDALVVVVQRLLPVAKHYGGLTDDHVSAIKDAEATILNFQIVPTVKESLTTATAIAAAKGE